MIVLRVVGVIVQLVEGFEGYSPSQPFTAQVRLKEYADPFMRGIERPHPIREVLVFASRSLEDGNQLTIGHPGPYQTSRAKAVQERIIAFPHMIEDEFAELRRGYCHWSEPSS